MNTEEQGLKTVFRGPESKPKKGEGFIRDERCIRKRRQEI